MATIHSMKLRHRGVMTDIIPLNIDFNMYRYMKPTELLD